MNIQEVNKFISDHKDKLDKAFPEGWFLSGSAFTVSKGYLSRDIHDLDIMTVGDHYGDGACRSIIGGAFTNSFESGKFYDDEGNLIKCFKISLDGVTLDIMHNPSATKDNVMDQIIKYKFRAILNPQMNPASRIKHFEDFEDLVDYCNQNCGPDSDANNLMIKLDKHNIFDFVHSDFKADLIKIYNAENSKKYHVPTL